MKTFMEEYGLIVVAAIIIMIFVLVATPIGTSLKDGVRTTVDKFTSSMVTDEDDTTSGSISVTAKDSEGNDLNASARNITGEEKDTLLASLESASLIASTEDVDALIDVQSDDFDGLAETTFDVSTIAKEGDTVVILHYDETAGEWEYITTDTVDANLTVGGDFSSYSPVAFVVISGDNSGSGSEDDNTSTIDWTSLEAGLYAEDGTIIVSWQELSDNGEIFVEDNKLIQYCVDYENAYCIVIDNSIEGISDNAFDGMGTFSVITIPSSVTSIGEWAFNEGCGGNLATINYKDTQAQWNNIVLGDYWNMGCPEITVHCTDGDVVIPATN